MHYLEAIIELLEYLPDEVRKKCFELQQLDLQYQEKMEKLKVDTCELTSSMQTLPQLEYERRHKEIQQRYQEAHEIADEKVQITEYLQSVLEKYQERVMKELVDFKADLEIDNPVEVDLIEKEFIQSIMSNSSSNDHQQGKREKTIQELAADDFTNFSNQEMPSTSSLSASAPAQSSSTSQSADHRLNGFGQSSAVEGIPKTHLPFQNRKITGQYDDFKVPYFRRPSQSVDRISMIQRGGDIEEDIFDTEISPPTKRQKPSSNHSQRLLSIAGGILQHSSRDNSPRPSGSHSSSHSPISSLTSSPAIGHPFSKFPFHPRVSAAVMTADQQFSKSMPSSIRQHLPAEGDQPFSSSSSSRPTTIRMPSFAEAQSFHGRPRKLTKKVEQMLIGSRIQGAQQNRLPSTSVKQVIHRRRKRKQQTENEEDQLLEEIDEEEDEEEELEDYDEEEAIVEGEEEEEADDRAWCYCKQGSAGNMVACDNSECPYIWFHYECVGIQQAPKGLWFCPTCSMKMNAIAQQQRSRSTSIDHK